MRQLLLEKRITAVKDLAQPMVDAYDVLIAIDYAFFNSAQEVEEVVQSHKSMFFENIPQKVKQALDPLSRQKRKVHASNQGYGQEKTMCTYAGQVIAVGAEVTRCRPGDWVVSIAPFSATPSDIVCVQEPATIKLKNQKNLRTACLAYVSAHALHIIHEAHFYLGQKVCVVGVSVVSRLVAFFAKKMGCAVFIITADAAHAQAAQDIGVDGIYQAHDPALEETLLLCTDQAGFSKTIVTCSLEEVALSFDQVAQMTQEDGTLVFADAAVATLGCQTPLKKNVRVLWCSAKNFCPHITSLRQCPIACTKVFMDLLDDNAAFFEHILHKEITLEELTDLPYDIFSLPSHGVLVHYGSFDKKKPQSATAAPDKEQRLQFKPAVKDILRVSFIGAQNLFDEQPYAFFGKMKNVVVTGVGDTMKRSNAESAVFEQDLADVVVIASSARLHAAQALQALQQNKAVFIHQPMATTFEQLEALIQYVTHNPSARIAVDYYRSFSPYIQKIKQALVKRTGPVMMHYTMNVEGGQHQLYYQHDAQAGRILSQASHIFDLFCFLIEQKPLAISVEALASMQAPNFPTDNVSVQISFQDGSVCSLLYTSLGSSLCPQERLEVFFDGKTIIMHDYEQIVGYGFPKAFDEATTMPDKGEMALLHAFLEHVRVGSHETAPISLERLVAIAHIALIVDSLACQGGGFKTLL